MKLWCPQCITVTMFNNTTCSGHVFTFHTVNKGSVRHCSLLWPLCEMKHISCCSQLGFISRVASLLMLHFSQHRFYSRHVCVFRRCVRPVRPTWCFSWWWFSWAPSTWSTSSWPSSPWRTRSRTRRPSPRPARKSGSFSKLWRYWRKSNR